MQTILYYNVLLALGCEKLLRRVRNMPSYTMCCCSEKTIHLGNVFSSRQKHIVSSILLCVARISTMATVA